MEPFLLTLNKIRENVEFFKGTSEKGYVQEINEIIASDPFDGHKFYIQSFVKRIDDQSGIKKMYHYARLTKPEPVPGHSLLRVDPRHPSEVKIMWSIPNQESFELYRHGKIYADRQLWEWIESYKNDPKSLCRPEPDDLSDNQIREIYQSKYKKKT